MKKKNISINKIMVLIIIITFLSITQTVSADFEIIQKSEEVFYMYVIDINDNGDVLGAYMILPWEWRVFIWSNGVMETLEYDEYNITVAWDFNDDKDSVGFYENMEENGPCLWTDIGLIDLTEVLGGAMAINNWMHIAGGRYVEETENPSSWGEHTLLFDYVTSEIVELEPLWISDDGFSFTFASAINEYDQIVGDTAIEINEDVTSRAYRWTPGGEGMINLGILSSEYEFSSASGINNDGDVIGTCYNDQCIQLNGDEFCWPINFRAFLYPDGGPEMMDLGMLPERTISEPRGINDNKLIVGVCANENTGEPFSWENQTAFIWREGEIFPLSEIIGVPDTENLMSAEGINNQGQIIGMASNPEIGEYCFLWTPHCPLADAGDDQTVTEENCMAVVTLDGSGSTDPDSTPDTNDDIVSFDWYEVDTLLGSGEIIEYSFPLGEHNVRLEVTDRFWQTDDDEVIIVIEDTTPPEVSVSVGIDSLWPPSHEMVEIGLSFEVSDNCDPEPEISIEITSDEPTATAPYAGGPGHAPDAEITGEGGVLLRAERSSEADGRVYEITVKATDASGNIAYSSTSVKVNHDEQKVAIDSGQNYDATVIN